MLLKVTNLVSKTGNNPQGLKKDAIYKVVAVGISFYHFAVEYTIMDEYGTVASYDQSHFEVIDNKVEADWIVKKIDDSYYQLIPECISYDVFTKNFYKGEKHAEKIFYQRFPEFKADNE